jgi:hypothetical protein
MVDGNCPRCGRREVRCSAGGSFSSQRRYLPVTTWSAARVVIYCCTACGHVEEYVEDRAALARIAERWKRVP